MFIKKPDTQNQDLNMSTRKLFYAIKPLMPRRTQIFLRRQLAARIRRRARHTWPIDAKAKSRPANWPGWPDDKRFAVVLTHDVEWAGGQEKCLELMRLEQGLGFKSSFNFVPERYPVSPSLRKILEQQGFEVGVHGLNHDGKLYSSKAVFQQRAAKINQYIQAWGAVGFRSPAMHHNLDWLHQLNLLYDASTFDTDPFEPQADGVRTIFPFWVPGDPVRKGYVELPYTLCQDFTVFIILHEPGIDIWKRKLDWVAEHGGMVLLNVHPDYLAFNKQQLGLETFPAERYMELLGYIRERYAGQYWHALPRDMAKFVAGHYAGTDRKHPAALAAAATATGPATAAAAATHIEANCARVCESHWQTPIWQLHQRGQYVHH